MKLRFRCIVCGKLTAGRTPPGGDGSARYPRRHLADGKVCEGNYRFAEWVEVDDSVVHLCGAECKDWRIEVREREGRQ